MKKTDLIIKNRPFYHYLLTIYSLMLRKKNMVIRGYSRASSRAIDLVNLLVNKISPGIYETPIPIEFGKEVIHLKNGNGFSLSYVEISPKLLRENSRKEKSKGGTYDLYRKFGPKSKKDSYDFNLCELEIFVSNEKFRESVDKIVIESPYQFEKRKGESIHLCTIILEDPLYLIPDDFFWDDIIFYENEENNQKIIKRHGKELLIPVRTVYKKHIYSLLVDALTRAGIIKSEGLLEFSQMMSFYDDVVLGLDTNMFYNCIVTSNLLDTFLGTPKADFLDTPNWILFLISEVSIGELEFNAVLGESRDPAKTKKTKERMACRALQEIMEIRRCADLEGICFMNVGNIPPEIDFSRTNNSIRDAIIREQNKTFFRQLYFPKGTYFLTQDRVCAMLGEAEGMRSVRVKKPNLRKESKIEMTGDRNSSISEILYELAVSFQPLEVKCMKNNGEILSFNIIIDWEGKDLKDWELWKLKLEPLNDGHSLLSEIYDEIHLLHKSKNPDPCKLIEGWNDLRQRYVSWDMM